MSKLQIKFVAGELTPGLENGEYDFPNGLTVRDVIAACERQYNVVLPEQNFKLMYPLYNGKPIQMDETINADGKLYICRVAMGG